MLLWVLSRGLLCVLLHSVAAFEAEDIIQGFQRSKQEVEAKWKYSEHTVCEAAGLHGVVEKRALASALSNIISPDDVTLGKLQAAGLPVFSGKQIYVSQKYKFIYIRHPKSSSSSMLAAIQAAFCGAKCSRHEYARMWITEISDAMWKEYFVFTVVRNPVARMLSSYNMFRKYLRKRLTTGGPGKSCNIPFPDFSRNVARLQSICGTDNCCAWVPLQSSGKYMWRVTFPSSHLMQQAHTTFTPEGDSIVDFIGRTEHIDEDWARIQTLIAERNGEHAKSVPMPYENPQGNHTEIQELRALAHPCLSPDVVQMAILNATTAFGLAQQFAMDMTAFQFGPFVDAAAR